MNAAIVVVTLVLLIQGTRIVLRPGAPPFVRGFGTLTLLLAGLILALFVMFFGGEGVLSPEFHAMMARGRWSSLVVLVVGFSVAAGLGLHVLRLKGLLPSRFAGLLFFGFAIGTAAATRIRNLNAELSGEDTAQAFWIYPYDLWWPPLLVWVSACFLDAVITILGVHDRRVRAGAFVAMLLVLSLGARTRRVFTDPTSATLWNLCAVGAALGGLVLILWVAWKALVRPADALPQLRAYARALVPTMRRQWEAAMAGGWPSTSRQAWSWIQPRVGQLLTVVALAMIAGSLIDIFYLGWLPRADALLVLAMTWMCLAEFTMQGPLQALVVYVVPRVYEGLASREWVRQSSLLLRARSAELLSRLGNALLGLVSLRSLPEGLAKLAVLVVGLVVVSEIPHAGKTLLQPFQATGAWGPRDQTPTSVPLSDIGRLASDHLALTLTALARELAPKRILLLPLGPGSLDSFLAGGSSVEVANVKLPVELVFAPILRPIRSILGVRVLDGSVSADGQGYTVLVRSSSGEIWRARATNSGISRPPIGDSADSGLDLAILEVAFQILSTDPALISVGMTRSWDAFQHFKLGLDRWSEFALQTAERDPDALSHAIWHFRDAIGIDPRFALAYYRLGLALQKDGQPLGAAEALRTSLKANPGFVPAMVALASVLYGSEHDLGPQPIWLPMTTQRPFGTAKRDEARHLWQSVINVESGASSLDRAAAWAGLCRYALDQPEHMHDRTPARESLSYRIAYFYCQQSERLYAAVFAALREDDDLRVKMVWASELAALGVLLERHGPKHYYRVSNDWQCSPAGIDGAPIAADSEHLHRSLPVGYYTRAALTYYRQALRLLPDDSVLRCHEASAAREPGLMQALRSEAASRWNLAEGYRSEARRHLKAALRPDEAAPRTSDRQDPGRRSHGELAAAYFGLALAEYQATLERDPTNVDAMNRYAQVFWDWRRGETSTSAFLEPGPGLEHGRRAEANARRAIAMIEAKQLGSLSQGYGPNTGRLDGRATQSIPIAPANLADRAPNTSPGSAAGEVHVDSIPRYLRPAATTAYASLGAVLLAVGRPHEAIEELKYAQQYAPEHASFDYVRWLFAQAHLCAARREFQDISGPRIRDDPRLEPIAVHQVEAASSLDAIRAHERTRESRPIAGLADIGKADDICRRDRPWPATPKDRKWMYELRAREVADNYRARCLWLGVTVELPEGWAAERDKALSLHVWGGGVDARIPVERRGRRIDRPDRLDPISLMPPPLRRFYFMAQLEDAQQQPVSPALFLKPPSEDEDAVSRIPTPNAVASKAAGPGADPEGKCLDIKNLILLTFDRTD